MSNLGAVIGIMASAFVVGALARFAVPGPDPMPAWLTIAIGLLGSVVGGGIAVVVAGRDPYAIELGAFFVAIALVVAYRRLVQKRPFWGPEALRFPRSGIGVQQYRDRLARAGLDPDLLLDRALEHRHRHDPPGTDPPAETPEATDEPDDPAGGKPPA